MKGKVILAVVLGFVASAFGAQQTINVGTTANDGTGDSLRAAFQKTQANFTDLYTHVYTPQGSATVVRVNSDGTTTYLTSTGLANWLGVATPDLLSSFAADPTSNGSWSKPTWLSILDSTQAANVGTPTAPESRIYTLTGPQWRRWTLVDPHFVEVSVNWREFPRGITYYTQLATDPAPVATEEGLVCTGRYSVYYKFNTGQMMPMKSLGFRFAETPTANGTYCTIGAQLVKDSSNYVGVLYDAVAQEVQIAGQLAGVFHKYVGFSVPLTSITPGTEVWMTAYQNDICAFIRYGTTGNYRFLGSAYTTETGRDLSLPATADAYTYGMLYASDGATSRIVVDKLEGGLGGGCGMREIRFIKDLTGRPVMSGDDYWVSFDVPFWYDTNKFVGVDANQTLGIPSCYLAIGKYKPGSRSVEMTRIIFAERACNDGVTRRLGNQDARIYLIDPTTDHWRIMTSGFDDYNFANNASQFYSYTQDYYGPLLQGPALKLTGLTAFSFGADHALYDLDVMQYGSYYWVCADLLGQSHLRVYRATLPDLSDATYFGTDASLTAEGCELERVGNELYMYANPPGGGGAYCYRLDTAASGDLFPARTGQISFAGGNDGTAPAPHHTTAQQQEGDGVHERSLRLTFTSDYVHGMIWTYGQTSERVTSWWTGQQYGRSRVESR